MERSRIRNLIDSGRAVALDCHAIGKTIPREDSIGTLFRSDHLNKSIILKQYEMTPEQLSESRIFSSAMLMHANDARKPVLVNTVVYFPYDIEDVYAGGESLVYTGGAFLKTLADKISNGDPSQDVIENLREDGKILDLLNSMHSLDPFLFRSKAEQTGALENIHASYFAITQDEWDEIQFPIHLKIQTLVTKALSESRGTCSSATSENLITQQNYVELFLRKIWEARDIEGIETFVEAMKIDPKKAPETFFAWKAICYYQARFLALHDPLKTLFQWVGNDELCYPIDPTSLPASRLQDIREERAILRDKMREGYVTGHKVLNAYESSYKQFVDNSQPYAFIKFLAKAENSYLLLANHVSVATHSLNLWRGYME